MELIDGKMVSKIIRDDLKLHVAQMKVKPVLSCILVGNDPASEIYVRNKVKACDEVGIESIVYSLSDNASQEELDQTLIEAVSKSDGVIVQRPLPNHLNTNYLEMYPEKDVDGFVEQNLGAMCKGNVCHIPATPLGILMLINYYHIDVENKNVVVIGRSETVGRPLSILLSSKPYNGNVTVVHSKTSKTNLNNYLLNADIIIVAVGKKSFLKNQNLKKSAVVIDVGIHRELGSKKLFGDVDQSVDYVAYKTPVPGGVGPMTITALLQNTINAAKH
jgi:methylenetetrahydrofolate dehydrogenase (NADP+) / methenyltetrahydrofolate cyclohydrolase